MAAEPASSKGPNLANLIAIATGAIALIGGLAYAIMRYSYQRFYDEFGLPPNDVGPSSAAALTQSGIHVAAWVALFAILPFFVTLLVADRLALWLQSDFVAHVGSLFRTRRPWPRVLWLLLKLLLYVLIPLVPAVAFYWLFDKCLTSGTIGPGEIAALAIAPLLLIGKRYAEHPLLPGHNRKRGRAERATVWLAGWARRLPRARWIFAATMIVAGAVSLAASLPTDARRTAKCAIDRGQPVRWVHTHRTFLGIKRLSHLAVLQVRADPARMIASNQFLPSKVSRFFRHRPFRHRPPLIYLGDAGGRDFVFDRRYKKTLQVSDGSVALITMPGPHCHWWAPWRRQPRARSG